MIARLVRYYRARTMRWAVRRLKIAGPGERLWLVRHRNTRRRQAQRRRSLRLLAKLRRDLQVSRMIVDARLAALHGDDPFRAPMSRGNIRKDDSDDARLDP